MSSESSSIIPPLAATLRGLRGEPDVHVVPPPPGERRFTRVPALAPGVDPLVGAPRRAGGRTPWSPRACTRRVARLPHCRCRVG